MTVSRRSAQLPRVVTAVAALLLPAIAAASPIPGLRMGPERSAGHDASAAASHGGRALESLWSTLSGSSDVLSGSWGALGGSFGTLTGHGGDARLDMATARPWRGSASAAGGNTRGSGNSKGKGPMSAEGQAGSRNAPLGSSRFGRTDDDEAIALAGNLQGDGHAEGWAFTWLFSTPGHSRTGVDLNALWGDDSGPLKIGQAEHADDDRDAARHQANDEGGDGGRPTVTQVPEPNSLLLLGTGAAALLATARRRKN